MQATEPRASRVLATQPARFVINGLVATGVHYLVLTLGLEWLEIPSAGAANLLASFVGVSVSFLGNRYFVFRAGALPMAAQAARFASLYASITCLHGAVLWVWSDLAGRDYRMGFVVATGLQMMLSFLGSKRMVFH